MPSTGWGAQHLHIHCFGCALQSLLDPSKGFKAAGLQGEAFAVAIGRIFAFAYVWALGGNLAPAARAGFDEHVREQLQDVVNIPGGW